MNKDVKEVEELFMWLSRGGAFQAEERASAKDRSPPPAFEEQARVVRQKHAAGRRSEETRSERSYQD